MPRNVTLLELVNGVAEHARSEAELIATVAYMVNRGHVRLSGNFKVGHHMKRGKFMHW